jgi:hypothetical protein
MRLGPENIKGLFKQKDNSTLWGSTTHLLKSILEPFTQSQLMRDIQRKMPITTESYKTGLVGKAATGAAQVAPGLNKMIVHPDGSYETE